MMFNATGPNTATRIRFEATGRGNVVIVRTSHMSQVILRTVDENALSSIPVRYI